MKQAAGHALSLMIFCAFAAAAPAARADVTVERYTKFGGFRGIGASEGTSIDRIKGHSKRSTSQRKMSGKLGGLFNRVAGDLGGDEIILVDDDQVISIDHKKKTYTVRPIALPEDEREAPWQQGEQAGEPEEPSRVKIIRNEFSVTDTGEKKTIGGFPCRRYVLSWLLETEDLDTGRRSTSTMTTDLWNTPETAATKQLQKEELLFGRAYLKKMGIEASPDEMKKFGFAAVAGLLGSDTDAVGAKFDELKKELRKVKGFSVATAVKWQSSGDDAVEDEPAGGGGGGLGGFVSGFAKKALKRRSAADKEGGEVIFESYTEIRRLDTAGLSDADFTVPEGYRQQ